MTRLRLQLVMLLFVVALLPVVPGAWIARSLFQSGLDPLLSETVLDGTAAGLDATRARLDIEKDHFRSDLAQALDVTRDPTDPPPGRRVLTTAAIDSLREREAAQVRTLVRRAAAVVPAADTAGHAVTGPDRVTLGGIETLVAVVTRRDAEPIVFVRDLPDALVAQVSAISEAHRLVQAVRHQRTEVVRSLLVTFLVAYGFILALVLVLGLVLASRLTHPLTLLGAGIERVGSGDLETPVPIAGGGAIRRLLAGFNAMTDQLRRQRDDLARLERVGAWRQMARRLAHEIKNPLTPIQLAAQQMRDSCPPEPLRYHALVHEGTAIIEEEVGSLRQLVVSFSEFARLPQPELRDVAIEEIVSDIEALYGDEALAVAELGSPDTVVVCDRQALHRVLINLVNNALDAQRGHGVGTPVALSVHLTDGDVVFRVADRGPGVPDDMKRRVFEPDVTTKSDGMGLGLAIVESVIGLHGGDVSVRDRDGGGAVFDVRLPHRPAQDIAALSIPTLDSNR